VRAICAGEVLAGSRGDEWSRGEDEMVAAMTSHKKADAGWKRGDGRVSLERDEGREEESYLVNLFALVYLAREVLLRSANTQRGC
jgi:hypothetical protein